MGRIYSKAVLTWASAYGRYILDTVKSGWIEYSGPLDLCCGASSQQTQIQTAQANYYNTLTDQAKQIFGDASSIFKDLQSTFAPILQKGPNQEGFSSAETQNLNNEITDDVGRSYHKAADAVNSQLASQGGGDVPIISGSQNQIREDLAASAASQEGSERQQVIAQDYATGRENFLAAASALSGSTNVFGSSTGAANAATGSGEAAANTANQIAQENNSWVNATIGALGSLGGAVATGGMKNLGAGKGFFG